MRKFICYILLFLLILLGLTFVALQTDTVKEYTLRALISKVEEVTGSQLKIEKFQFFLPLRISAQHIEISDKGKIWLSVDQTDLSLSPFDLISGNLNIDLLNLHGVTINKKEEEKADRATLETLPNIPLTIAINQFTISKLILEPSLKESLKLSSEFATNSNPLFLNGNFFANPLSNSANLKILIEEGKPSLQNDFLLPSTEVSLEWKPQTGSRNLSIDIKEIPSGVIFKALNIHEPYAFNGHVDVLGSPESWLHILGQKEDSQIKFNGNLNFQFHNPIGSDDIVQKGFLKTNFDFRNDKSLQVTDIKSELGPFGIEGNLLLSANNSIDDSKLIITVLDSNLIKNKYGFFIEDQSHLECSFSGDLNALFANIYLQSKKVQNDKIALHDLNLKGHAQYGGNGLTGAMEISASDENHPITLSSNFSLDQANILVLHAIHATYSDAHASGRVQIALPSLQATGEFEGGANLLVFNKFLESNLQGIADFTTTFQYDPNEKTSLDLSIKSSNAQIDHTLMQDVELEAAITDLIRKKGSFKGKFPVINLPQGTIRGLYFVTEAESENAWPFQLYVKTMND
jgi:autotransporter translocation and assembly factor TamB